MSKRKRCGEDLVIRDDEHGQGTFDELLRDAELMGGGVVSFGALPLQTRKKR